MTTYIITAIETDSETGNEKPCSLIVKSIAENRDMLEDIEEYLYNKSNGRYKYELVNFFDIKDSEIGHIPWAK